MLEGADGRDALESHHKFQLSSESQGPIRLQLWQSDASKEISGAVSVETGLQVDVSELRNRDCLPEKLRIRLSITAFARDFAVRVDVFKPGNVIDLCQFFGFLIQSSKHFIKMVHVLEDKSLSLVQHDILNVRQEICVYSLLKIVGLIIHFLACHHSDG